MNDQKLWERKILKMFAKFEKIYPREKKVVIFGRGNWSDRQGLFGWYFSRVRDQFLFLISGIVLLTLLVNATTIKALVNKLGLTELPAVKN